VPNTDPLKNIRVVLCAPVLPGNIGAAARAMKTMGLARLYLVAPRLSRSKPVAGFARR
jgi:tRNA/rRNA methyltransferase